MKKALSIFLSFVMLLSVTTGFDLSAYADCEMQNHNYETIIKKATISKNGSVITKCSDCGVVESDTVIYYPKYISLSSTSFTYNGKAKKPGVTVKDSQDNEISSEHYTLSYHGKRINAGIYTVTIRFQGNYSGTVTKSFTVNPDKTSLSKLVAGGGKITVKWKKQAVQTTGYQIQYSTDKGFKKNNKITTVSDNKTTSKTISRLKENTKYYVRIRTYKAVQANGENTKVYSSWSKSMSIKTITMYEEKSQAFIKDKRWKNNISWNADQEPKVSSYVAWGCVAYVSDFCKYVYGCSKSYHNAKSTFKSVGSIKSGDVLRLSNSRWGTHWIVVIRRDGNKLYTAEGNVYNGSRGRTAVGDSYYTISGNRLKRHGDGSFSLTKGYHMY